jgi:NADPH-dependent glutamate synthase beta subunit-like oxidoreductase
LEGEELDGVYHAKDVVYGYNSLPPYSQKKFRIGKRCAIIGAGNVMVDVARHLIQKKNVDEVIVVNRRGPAEVNFTKDEMKHIIANLDVDAFEDDSGRLLLQAADKTPKTQENNGIPAQSDPKLADGRIRFILPPPPA